MTKRTVYLTGVFLLLGLFIFTACDSFYGNSWGESRGYNTQNMNVTISNLPSWEKAARYNPALAKALAEVINGMMVNMPDGPDKAKFQKAGVEFAIKSAGLGKSFLNNIDKLADSVDNVDADAFLELIGNIQNDFNNSNGSAAAKNLTEIVTPQGGFGSTPEFDPYYGEIAEASDVGQAVIILTMALLKETDETIEEVLKGNDVIDFDIWDLDLKIDNEKVVADGNPSPEAQALAAYINLINSDTTGKYDKNPITSEIKKIFSKD